MRLDFVEQRHDQHRRELAEDDADDEERGGGDQPPVRARVPDDPEQADVERDAQQRSSSTLLSVQLRNQRRSD